MTFYVNAWLDRVDPFVSIHDKQTGELIVKFDKVELQECLEQGDFCLSELCDTTQRGQQELIKALLLTHCAHDLRSHLEQLSTQCHQQRCAGYPAQLVERGGTILPFRRKTLAANTAAAPRWA